MTIHALTIDLEDWHQLFFRKLTGELPAPSTDVVDATKRLLDLLDESGARCTFFVVGLLAAARPELVREVARRGHEIGSHSYEHALISAQTRAQLRADLDRARKLLQDVSGQAVLGFRAPEFSVQRLDHWCFDVLAEVGFAYDSSVFPARARYGIADAPRRPFTIATPSGAIREYPLATWEVAGRRVAIAGGTWWRLLPRGVVDRAMESLDRAGDPAVLYFHPYEFNGRLLRLSNLGWRRTLSRRYLQYVALHNLRTRRIAATLRRVLGRFRFSTLERIYRAEAVDAARADGGRADEAAAVTPQVTPQVT